MFKSIFLFQVVVRIFMEYSNVLPCGINLFKFVVKSIDDYDIMTKFIHTHMRYNHSYIGNINMNMLFTNIDEPINKNDVLSHYYLTYKNGYYTLYFRMLTDPNSLEDCYRIILYSENLNFKLGRSFKEIGYYFNTIGDAENYLYSSFNMSNSDKDVQFCCTFYTNVEHEYDTFIVVARWYINHIRLLYFDANLWDINSIQSIF